MKTIEGKNNSNYEKFLSHYEYFLIIIILNDIYYNGNIGCKHLYIQVENLTVNIS